MRNRLLLISLAAIVVAAGLLILVRPRREAPGPPVAQRAAASPRLCWFIPDGMRADPDLFNIYRWAEEGKLPNIKKMMERGSYGYCKPVFPSHTPANFATLFTGAFPEKHGVNDGPMRAEGQPLNQIAMTGFSSAAKRVEPFWVTVERSLRCRVALLSVPGSTPPELKHGLTIRGRWGRWGADFHSVNFQDDADPSFAQLDRKAARLFFTGPNLTQRITRKNAEGWDPGPRSYSQPLEATLSAWGATNYACLVDSSDNGAADYDTIVFSADKKRPLCSLKHREWSDWLPITLKWQIPGQPLERQVDTFVKVKVIHLGSNGLFRVRFVYNNINKHLTDPGDLADDVLSGAGPMVDFVDNFPAQLIHYPEDKETFLEEAGLSLAWHRAAADYILRKHKPDIFISDTYTPNQMLTTRWWMGYIDPASARYGEVSDEQRSQLWEEVHWLYQKLDDVVGELLKNAGPDTFVVLSSDHGAVPLNSTVRLNNLFAREGLLKFSSDPKTGETQIDWDQTRAVFLNMHNVYLSPSGLGGNWKRSSGPEYLALREKVKSLLTGLRDANGQPALDKIVNSEDAEREFRLLPERAGDLIIANRPGYGWSEELTADLAIFGTPLITGYKQAILADNVKGLWTPFIIVGPGIRKGHFLGAEPITMTDQYPTLLRCLGLPGSAWAQGTVVAGVFE